MRRVLEEALRLLDAGERVAIATVVDAKGSVPGKRGAKMLVRPDGATVGTVGGAGLEERVKALALDALRTKKGGLHRFDLAAWKPGGLNSVCGGTVDVAIEVLEPVPHLLLAGAGHVAKALHDVASLLGWRVSVQDDRPEYASRDRFPHAVDVVLAGPEWFSTADLGRYTHLYLLGYSHDVDTEILKRAVTRFPGTFGVIGSRAKRESMWERARKAGVADDALDRVVCPIGLDLGAETPEEIAIAVVAQILQETKGSP